MRLSWETHPVTLERRITLRLTQDDLFEAYGRMSRHDRWILGELDRPGASIEERLMAAQMIARHVEEPVRSGVAA